MTAAKKIVRCPGCGFRFDVSYSRVFACGDCPMVISCNYVKCPRCGEEFSTSSVNNSLASSPG
ncbi:MAG: hypothetical protein J7K49_02855 [Thaumarchaeota archaeon]|nr:hypothetical protein [Nitrososphaerota archaeon]